MSFHLMRTYYPTDATDDDPVYQGTFSGTIPDRVFQDGSMIVDVDWSERGWVAVTYLSTGDGVDR